MNAKIQALKSKALEENIPIMMDDTINYIKKLIEMYKITDILEIGTAVGFSAINFALVSKDVKLISIERDQNRFIEAVKNVKDFDLSNQI